MAAIRQYLGLAQLAFILHLSPYVIRVVGDYRMWSMPKLTVRRVRPRPAASLLMNQN